MFSEKIKDREFITCYIAPEVIFIDKFLHKDYLIFSDYSNCFEKTFIGRYGAVSIINGQAIRKFLRNHFRKCQE